MIAIVQRWRERLGRSVRLKLLAIALAPLLIALPLLLLALSAWTDFAYDRLLHTKVRADLAVARGYFGQVLAEVGAGTRAAASHTPCTKDCGPPAHASRASHEVPRSTIRHCSTGSSANERAWGWTFWCCAPYTTPWRRLPKPLTAPLAWSSGLRRNWRRTHRAWQRGRPSR